jgi:hypothetical protein
MASRAPVSRSTITATARTMAPASRGGPRRRRVLHNDDATALHVRPLDAALHSVSLRVLADHEGVEVPATGRGGVQEGGRDGVGAEGQAANGVDLAGAKASNPKLLEHDVPHERRSLMVEGHPTQIDVVVGLPPRGEGDPSADHCRTEN